MNLITLTTGTAAQLVVDTAGFVTLGTDVQTHRPRLHVCTCQA